MNAALPDSRGPLPKIFGIGLNKTGTSSLGEALNLLRIKTIHYPCDDVTYRQLIEGDLLLSILSTHQGIVDTPVAPYYPQLSCLYPGSKFILTVRDKDAWLRSIEAHWQFTREWCRHDSRFRRFSDFMAAAVYGTLEFNAERFSYIYDLHYRNVMQFFSGRPQDLLLMDICRGDGWDKLCGFLGRDVPDVEFPHVNRKEEKADRWEWMGRLDLAARELAATVDRDDSFALADDLQLAGSILAARATGRLFEHDGVYYGPPGDDRAAIAETQRLREAGMQLLVVAWPAFWWFEHFPNWDEFLRDTCPEIYRGTQLRIFDLVSPTWSRSRVLPTSEHTFTVSTL